MRFLPPPMTESAQQRYRVVEKLESGGMAEVFRAESEGLQGFRKQVAIKRVLPHLSEKKKFIAMFLDEARLSAQLSHSNSPQPLTRPCESHIGHMTRAPGLPM